jgi:hypothetical protein
MCKDRYMGMTMLAVMDSSEIRYSEADSGTRTLPTYLADVI